MSEENKNIGESMELTGGYQILVAPADEGGAVYHAPESIMRTLRGIERDFAPLVGGQLFFTDAEAHHLTPFAARLFERGYVSVEPSTIRSGALMITDVQPEIEARLMKVLAQTEDDQPSGDDVVVNEAELPFDGRLGALPEGVRTQRRRTGSAGRPDAHPIELLENLLYGATSKDDPEGSHHAEHEISDGVDKG